MSRRKELKDDEPEMIEQTTDLAQLLGPHRRRELRRMAKRLLVAGLIAAGPLYLLAVRVDGIKDLGGLVVLTALFLGVPAYLIVIAGPTAWREQVIKRGLPAAWTLTDLQSLDLDGNASVALAGANKLELLPDYNRFDVSVGLTGSLDGVPTRLFDLTLTQTGGTGRRVVFKGLLFCFDLPQTTGITATVRARSSFMRRLLQKLWTKVRRSPMRELAQTHSYTIRSDAPEKARTWITPEVLTALEGIGRAEGRRLDTTTFASILCGLLTSNMREKAVAAGVNNETFYLIVDRRSPLVRAPHPLTAPRTPEALTDLWDQRLTRILQSVRYLLKTTPFRA
ncbi:hypothetical protein [Fodinicurvata sediminis]|uniref:hypothetical protein n=1 Tax=Fodinicurvata sediminis TaxID=1121832 RepID=UPI00047BFACC|nr:hypothetical protein [Fodinicurvata sediminis]